MRALVVEDEPAISRILTRKLSRMGFECSATESILESKKILESESIDLLFLDYVLVDGRSRELAVEGYLKNIGKIYLMSAFMDDLEKKDFEGLNVTFLKKPFKDLNEVLSEVESLL
jgi:DNA-binding response OmpR family regulator